MKKFSEDVDVWFDKVAEAAKSGRNSDSIRELLGIAKLEPTPKHLKLFRLTVPVASRRVIPWAGDLRMMAHTLESRPTFYAGDFRDQAGAIRELFSMFRQAASHTANGRQHRPNTMRSEKKWAIGDRGAEYEFKVKLSMKVRGVNITDAELEEETLLAVEEFADQLRSDYPWIGEVGLTGRSGGWLAITDDKGEATEDQLSDINDRVTQARKDFETALVESFGYTENGTERTAGHRPNARRNGWATYAVLYSLPGELRERVLHVSADDKDDAFDKGREELKRRRLPGAAIRGVRFPHPNDVDDYQPNARQLSLRGPAFVDPKLRKAYDFFKAHAGGQVGHAAEGALNLARAEKIADDHGWEAVWEEDPEEYQMGDAETERPFEVLDCVLKDENGEVLESLGGIGMSGNTRQDRDYGRLVEAELALEAASRKGLL